MQPTAKQQMIEMKLGGDLGEYVRGRYAQGFGWRRIAEDLRRETGFAVSHEALRGWYSGDVAA